MRRRTVRLATIAVVLGGVLMLGAGAAQAHPLGNFTINLYDGLAIHSRGVDVDHVIDMAEIPAFQERSRIDANGDGQIGDDESAAYVARTCAGTADDLAVSVDGTAIALHPSATGSLTLPPGAGGLSTLRVECSLHAEVTIRPGTAIAFRDDADPGRIGWHEVTAAGDGMTLARSDVPATSSSGRLTAYPADLLSSPLDQRSASIVAGTAADTDAAPATDLTTAPIARGFGDRFTTAFASLVTTGGSSPLLWLLALATAFAIGGLHALGPGHGKTLMAAYLVGTDVRPRQIVAVGAAVSAMHTASVVALGLTVLAAGQAFTPEVAYQWTTLASGALVAILGGYLLVTRSRAIAHGRAYAHGHDHDHTHEPRSGRFGLATLAVSGGILPSPSALIALLAAVAIGRLVFGLALVLAFGVGLAAVLMGVGFGTIRVRDLMGRRLPGALATWAPVLSAAGICLLGVALVARTATA
jgi:ABC-type nickel/cobalt efflux system permease component RcnA